MPIGRVVAIYARENGEGMAFPSLVAPVSEAPAAAVAEEARVMQLVADESAEPDASDADEAATSGDDGAGGEPPKPAGAGGRPALKRIK